MRPLIITFLILSPFIAIAENFPLHETLPAVHAQVAQLAQQAVDCAGTTMGNVFRAVQASLG